MLRALRLLSVLFFGSSLWALEGRVVRPDGTPVIGATVSILGLPGAVRTDSQGRFDYRPDPQAPFEVLVVLSNGAYSAPFLVEEIPQVGPLIVEMAPLLSEAVTVDAAVTPNIEALPASGMTTIGSRELERLSPVRLTDALLRIPGVSTLSDLHTAVPSIRGLARGRTLILIDDNRVTTERRAGPSASYLDPFFLQGIEVSRGPGSVAYGSDAFGGVIHARTRRPALNAPFSFRFKGTLAAGLPERTAAAEIAKGAEKAAFLFQGRYRSFDDYDSPRGRVDNSAASDRGFLARTVFETGGGLLSLGWQSDWGRSNGRPDTRNPDLRVFQPEENSHRLTVGWEAAPRWGLSRFKFDGFVGAYRLVTARDTPPQDGSPRQVRESDVDAKDYAFRAVAVRPSVAGRLEFGVDVNGRFDLQAIDRLRFFDAQDRRLGTSERSAILEAGRDDLGLFFSTDQALHERVQLSAGARYDRVTTHNRGQAGDDVRTSNDALSGFLALSTHLSPGLTLTGQVARGFRDPTLSDRYFTGLSGRGVVSGNPFLTPEESLQFDVSLRSVSSKWRWAVFYYHYRIDDLIERFESGQDQFFLRNRGRARIQGLEWELQGTLPAEIGFSLGAQVSSGRAVDDDADLDDIPVAALHVSLRKALAQRGYLQVQGSFFKRDRDPGPTEIVVPSYGTLDTSFGWKLRPGFELRFVLRNLLDKDYPISPDRRSVGAPGISGLVTLLVELGG